jgi:signal transduction histidine kinase
MLLQAGGASRLLRTEPERAEEALERVDDLGQQAIQELRHLLNMLQVPGEPANRDMPLPSIQDLCRLIEQANSMRPGIELIVVGEPHSIDPAPDVAAYRIVQEALTNATRYAPPGTPIHITITWLQADIDIAVSNLVDRDAARGDLSLGRGLVTMTERARTCGGILDAGPQPGGLFLVRALLPTKVPIPVPLGGGA